MTWRDPIVSMFVSLLLWGSLFELLYIRDRVVYGRAQSAPAAQKAEALIREWLSPAQLHDYSKRKKFQVTGSAGGRYLIAPGYIRDLDTGQHICFVPENWHVLPVADIMLARKIALENDEVSVLKVAFRGPGV
jgi:hypothetical protein